MDTYNLTKILVQKYKDLRKETTSTHKFLAKAKNLFFASKEFHLSESDIEFLNKDMDFLEEAYNKIFEKNSCFSNLTETGLEDIKKNLEFFTIKYENYYEYLKFAREILSKFLLFVFSLLIGKEAIRISIQIFFQNAGELTFNIIDVVFYVIFFLVIVYFIYASIPQIIINIQAKREILKEIEIILNKRIQYLQKLSKDKN